MLGLVLTAGGARGAYQAGVLKRVGEMPLVRDAASPFAIIAGASAGAINGALLAARSERFGEATREIAHVWGELSVEQVFRTDLLALALGAAGMARDAIMGPLGAGTWTTGLLDTTPLETLLENALPPTGILEGIRSGRVYAVAVTATSYHSGRSYTFVQGRQGHPIWSKSRRVVLPVTLNHKHILASGAIPIVFPPVRLVTESGELWFGDGGMRLVAPLSPAIRLGATHVFAVGIRSSRAADVLASEEAGSAAPTGANGPLLPCPPLAQVCGVFMNAIFLDHLDTDLDHLKRMNELVSAHPPISNGAAPAEPMRLITPFVIAPSEDLALVAQRFAHRMPRLVRLAMDGLGTPDAQSADLMSYLLFDAAYTRTLVDIGYRDADARIGEIEEFLVSSGAVTRPSFEYPMLAPAASA